MRPTAHLLLHSSKHLPYQLIVKVVGVKKLFFNRLKKMYVLPLKLLLGFQQNTVLNEEWKCDQIQPKQINTIRSLMTMKILLALVQKTQNS